MRGRKKSGGAAALPAPPPPRSLVLLQRFSNWYISSQILAREHPERFKRITLQSSPVSIPSLSFLTRCCPCRMSAAFRFLLGISSNKTCINRRQIVKKNKANSYFTAMRLHFLQGKGRTTDYIQTIVCFRNFLIFEKKKKQPLPCKNPWKCPQGPCSHHLRRTVKKVPRLPAQGRMSFCENRNTEYVRTRTTSKWPALVQVKMTVLQ